MEFKDQLKASVDIVKVIGEYVRLRKAGTRYVGLCPFHTEKSPSFSVHPVKGIYYCFGCNKGGDVLSFVMEIEGLSFYEALKQLAERNGIPMPKRAEYADADTKLRAAVYQMQEIAARAFQDHLRGPAGAEARAYIEKRGVARELIEHFGLGYSDRSGRHLLRLIEKDFSPELMEQSGLVGKRDDGSLYDRFRHRLMFPIHNESGKTIGFGGRALDPSENAKYINSPETPIYKKSFVLYNLHRAKEGVRKSDRVVLVEGYMDVIGVWEAGIHEVVAPCGTALTAQQVQMMRRHSLHITVNFDPDAAGASAAERSIQMLLDEGMHVRIVELDGDLDPDEYCKQRGAEAYRARLDGARNYFHWLADRARARFGSTAEGRVEGLKFLLPAIQRLSDKIERATIANDVAAYLGVPSGMVLDNFRRSAADRSDKPMKTGREPLRADEKILLNLLLANPAARRQLIPLLREMPAVEQFATRRIFRALFGLDDSGAEVGFHELHDRLEEDDRQLLAAAVLLDETNETGLSLEQGMACLKSLERSGEETRRAALKARVREAERSGDMAEALRLSQELNRLGRVFR